MDDPMEIWIEFTRRNWRISPDPARVPCGALLWWRFRVDHLKTSRVRWTIYFSENHPFGHESDGGPVFMDRMSIATETLRLPDGQHVGSSPILKADAPGEFKYGVRLHDLDEDRELGDEDPLLIVF